MGRSRPRGWGSLRLGYGGENTVEQIASAVEVAPAMEILPIERFTLLHRENIAHVRDLPSLSARFYTRSHASAGIQWRSLPFHFTLQPSGLVTGTATSRPASRSSTASRSSCVVSLPGLRGLSSMRPV